MKQNMCDRFLSEGDDIIRDGNQEFLFQSQEDFDFADKVKECVEIHGDVFVEFVHQWKLFQQGHKGIHGLFCDIAFLFSDHQDFLAEFTQLFKGICSKSFSGTEI